MELFLIICVIIATFFPITTGIVFHFWGSALTPRRPHLRIAIPVFAAVVCYTVLIAIIVYFWFSAHSYSSVDALVFSSASAFIALLLNSNIAIIILKKHMKRLNNVGGKKWKD